LTIIAMFPGRLFRRPELHCSRPPRRRRLLAGAALLALAAHGPGSAEDRAAPAAAAAAATPAAPYRAPYLPQNDAEVLQQVPAGSDPAVRQMRTLGRLRAAAPNDLRTVERLARAYIDFGRQVGDAHYAGYAEALIAPWLGRQPPVASVLVLQATILQYRHQFAEARAMLKNALQQAPRDPQAWLTLATLDMVGGDYRTAGQDCAQVARTGGTVLGLACSGNLRSYVGQARQSIALLTQIGADSPDLSAPFKAWVQGMLAESAERLGEWRAAEAYYRKALSYAPGDNFLLVAYADYLLDRNRPAEVLDLLAGHAQSDTAFLRVALAQAALGSPDLARYTWIMAARFEALAQRGSDYYGREQVRFALALQHDPQAALALAQRNWQVQRAPWDARVFLEAAQAANQGEAAAPVLAFLEQTRLQDPIIEALARQLRAQLASASSGAP
jgi:Tfp pilus assembly protein PilF